MAYTLGVLAAGLFAGTILFGVARLVVLALPHILAWRSPLRLLMVFVVWFVVSAALVWPLYAMLISPAAVVAVWDDSWRLVSWLIAYALSLVPFGVVMSRHRDRIVVAAKHALVA